MEKDYSVRMGFVDDYVCAICDEGGDLISCGGDCGRSFHPTKPTGAASGCKTLGLSEQLEISKFLCKNCEYKEHQCFVCGKLGSSDQVDKKQEIIQCNKKGCKRFYHPHCLPLDVNKIPEESCPMHECYSYKKKHATSEGNKMTKGKSKGRGMWEMDLVLCRRCPKAFHRKCLPRKISGGIIGKIQRRWEIAGRTVFYCRDHEMANGLRSSVRAHIEFPESRKGSSENQSVPEGHVDDGNKGSGLVLKNMT